MHLEFFFAQGKWNFELVHILLINWIVLIWMHALHCLFSLVMENSCSRQFFEVIQQFLVNCIAYCLVMEFLLEAVGILSFFKYSWSIRIGMFFRHAWLTLPVFFYDGKFLLEAVGIFSLSKYSSSIGLFF